MRTSTPRIRSIITATLTVVILAAFAALLALPTQAQTQTPITLVSNTETTVTTTNSAVQAQSFVTGANAGEYTISEVQMRLGNVATGAATKPKPRWDVHLPGAGNRGGSLAGVFRPLIAGPSGSAVSPRLSGWTARPGICRHAPDRRPAAQAQIASDLLSRPTPDSLIGVEVRAVARQVHHAPVQAS